MYYRQSLYYEAIYKILKNEKNGLTNIEIYDGVNKQIKNKGKWWQKTVRTTLKKYDEFIAVDDKWRLK